MCVCLDEEERSRERWKVGKKVRGSVVKLNGPMTQTVAMAAKCLQSTLHGNDLNSFFPSYSIWWHLL